MILDPFGDVIAECRKLGNDIAMATLTPEKLKAAGGSRYIKVCKPTLYSDIIGQTHFRTEGGLIVRSIGPL